MKEKALKYHELAPKGKIEITPTKPCKTQEDLSLAYTPGVAEPVKEIGKNPLDVYRYTNKGNLVAIISNGTAILGLGDLGPLASKPVMEGKSVLFKHFGKVDAFDIEVDTKDPQELLKFCELIAPTFGGINLEDIKAPECFYLEKELKKLLDIPVFHDDQHGTAIIAGAGILNALEIIEKKIEDIKIVINGAGAAGVSCADFLILLGAKKENMIMCDSKGVIYKGREFSMNEHKERFASDVTHRTLEDAMNGADLFLGVSIADVVTPEMLLSMADNPIVFALANPDPEIEYKTALRTRDDIIMAAGRSDYPNQVNNVLGFPFIFRGALDTWATDINDEMKLACAYALANLAKKDVPEEVCKAYNLDKLCFGRDYLIPKPFDPRLLAEISSAVAEAAIKSGVAQKEFNIEEYKKSLL
jgi:malate dehydrogenase (oxaloacetate-decarboxylating)(NADP+)